MEMSLLKRNGLAASRDRDTRMTGLRVLYLKELRDYFRSKRFLVVLLIIVATGFAGVYGAISSIQSAIDRGTMSDNMFLSLFTSSGGSWLSFVWFLAFLGPVVGLAMGFDAINGERSHRTLSRLLAQPIHRDAIVNGKFLAGVTVIAIMVFSLGFIVSGVGLIVTGLVPTLEQWLRILCFLLVTTVYMSLFLAVSLLLSLLFRHMATSALSGIAIWLFFTLFVGLLAAPIAGAFYPLTDTSTVEDQLHYIQCVEAVNRLSPTTLYSESISTILDPSVRTLTSAILSSQVDYALVGNLPLGQSLLLVWPHLTGLIALTMISFGISYVCFMRQEVRTE
jgi:ABC-2 type transport system permease protein